MAGEKRIEETLIKSLSKNRHSGSETDGTTLLEISPFLISLVWN